MTRWLKQSTSVDVPIGPFLDATDGVTAETGLTLTQPDIRLKKNGGAWAQKNAAQTLSHEENGYYEVTLDATDTGTLGLLRLAVNESGALPIWEDFLVVPANVWDTWFGSDVLDVSVTQWLGTAAATPTVAGVPEVDVTHWLGTAGQGASGRPQVDVELWLGSAPNALVSGRVDVTVGAMQTGVLGAAAFAAGAIDAAALAADAGTEIGTAVWATTTRALTILDEDSTTLDLDATIRAAVGLAAANLDTQIGTLATAANLATVDTVVDAIQAKTDNLPTDPADASVIAGRFDTLDTSIADLPTNAELATALGTADDAVLTAIGALETHGDSTWATATGFSTHSAADVWSVATRVLTASTNLGDLDDAILAILGTPAGASIAADIANISAGSGPTASQIADEVQTRTIAAVTTVGTVTGEVSANIVKVNNVTVDGVGTEGDPFGPA